MRFWSEVIRLSGQSRWYKHVQTSHNIKLYVHSYHIIIGSPLNTLIKDYAFRTFLQFLHNIILNSPSSCTFNCLLTQDDASLCALDLYSLSKYRFQSLLWSSSLPPANARAVFQLYRERSLPNNVTFITYQSSGHSNIYMLGCRQRLKITNNK